MYNLSLEQLITVRELKTFPNKVRYLRINVAKKGAGEFAKEFGITYRTLWTIERRENPMVKTICKYAEMFNLPMEVLQPKAKRKGGNK